VRATFSLEKVMISLADESAMTFSSRATKGEESLCLKRRISLRIFEMRVSISSRVLRTWLLVALLRELSARRRSKE
jgi:hypothetical protein